MKIFTVIGARPQFVKAAVVSRELSSQGVREFLVHTGQHYDDNMSRVFFEQLEIPAPDVNLEVGSGTHAFQTARMLEGIERLLIAERPDAVLVYGDTNSTLAGALAAVKRQVPVVHVEAGLRSFNRAMPEEINRIVTDRISDLLLCPSQTAVEHLRAEGITEGVRLVGDVMRDALEWVVSKSGTSDILERLNLVPGGYGLMTLHRAENTDDPGRLRRIFAALERTNRPLVLPLHPRTRKALERTGITLPAGVRAIPPVGYPDFVRLEKDAALILTDSGGMQKEAYWLGVPCVTLRDETEWVETVEAGWNRLVGADTNRIVQAVESFTPPLERPELYGDGHAAQRCVEAIRTMAGSLPDRG